MFIELPPLKVDKPTEITLKRGAKGVSLTGTSKTKLISLLLPYMPFVVFRYLFWEEKRWDVPVACEAPRVAANWVAPA
jgi:hypothetical protein